MCLAVPGEIIELIGATDDRDNEPAIDLANGTMKFARVKFGSVIKKICLAYTPEALPGDYIIAHTGFALQILDQAAAEATLALLNELPGAQSDQGSPMQ
ncbi:MAG: HypC/HybG/HupF family hydrogenase formation chaperone [Gammaproteobacteria bacterium]